MKILGVNFGHDSAVAYIENGKLLYAIEEEKASRVKQDFGWPRQAIETLISKHHVKPEEIDLIAFGGHIHGGIGKNEIRYRFSKKRSDKNNEVIDRLTTYLNLSASKISEGNVSVFEKELQKRGFSKARIGFHQHHLSHAASAFYCAPFDTDLVITCDGQGDGDSFNFYVFDPKAGLKCLHQISHEASVGQFYSGITRLLGFRPTRHEGKITGSAAFGKPTDLVNQFESLFYYENDALHRYPHGLQVDQWRKYKVDQKLNLRHRINLRTSESETGTHYAINALILDAWLQEVCIGFSKEDIAFACQQVSENVVVREVERVYKTHFRSGKIKVSLGGGVFANVRINQKIYESDFVENIFVQPAMGDSGLALGAAILAEIQAGHAPADTQQFRFKNTYLGPDYGSEVEPFLQSKMNNGLSIRKMEDAAKEIAQMIASNKIVGFWHGPMEWGPRALGSRSILLNTFDRSVNDSLNQRLNRTEFMPFAPSVIDYKAKTYFPKYDPEVPAADYMTITYDTAPEFHEQLQAVVHVDGTARPQVVTREMNPYYYDILDEFCKITGCGAVVNTSFNAHEEPIVSSPESAFNALTTDRIDCLILDDYLILKTNS